MVEIGGRAVYFAMVSDSCLSDLGNPYAQKLACASPPGPARIDGSIARLERHESLLANL